LEGRDLTPEVGAKRMALLALLARVAPAPMPRERLAGTSWSEKREEAARYRLRHALWDLRRIGFNRARMRAGSTPARGSGSISSSFNSAVIGAANTPKAVVVADALWCGTCKPEAEPVPIPEIY
jgi:hypothetical protein